MRAILLPTLQGARFLGLKSRLKSILDPKSRFKVEKVDFKHRFFDLKCLDSHSFENFKFLEATQNKSRKTIFDNPNYFLLYIFLHKKNKQTAAVFHYFQSQTVKIKQCCLFKIHSSLGAISLSKSALLD